MRSIFALDGYGLVHIVTSNPGSLLTAGAVKLSLPPRSPGQAVGTTVCRDLRTSTIGLVRTYVKGAGH